METIKYASNFGNLEVTLLEYSKNRIKLQRPLEFRNNSSSSLPKLQFQNLDSVLKRQLYEKSFPVIRKHLWLASKKTGNLGKKPVTYLFSNATFKNINSKENSPNSLSNFFVNKVFHVYHSVNCRSVNNLDTRKIQRFFVFANTKVSLLNSREIKRENLKLFVNPRVDSLSIHKMNIRFNSAVKFRKYLGSLFYHDPLPNDWESILFNSETQFGYLWLAEAKVDDYESMRNFVNCQPSDFIWHVKKNIIYNQEFLKHFKECDLKNHDVPHLSHYSATARKTIHFCSIISTANETKTPNESTVVVQRSWFSVISFVVFVVSLIVIVYYFPKSAS